ncbi:MAG: hypothetical protein ACXWPM_02040 [Bdellovibrionota bacterium]
MLRRFAATGALFFSLSALATTFVDRPFPETVQDSPVIIHGTIGNSWADWGKLDGDGGKRIFTYSEVFVAEVLKGAADPKKVVIREMGGEKDGLGMQVAGSAQFTKGEDVVVFLNDRNDEGTFDVRNMMMGKFNLVKDTDGVEVLTGPGLGAGGRGILHDDDQQPDTHRQKRPTLEALRKIIQSQGGGPLAPPSEKISVNPPVTATPAAAPSRAPVLQPEDPSGAGANPDAPSEGKMAFPSQLGIALGGAGALVLLLVVWRVRRRKKR